MAIAEPEGGGPQDGGGTSNLAARTLRGMMWSYGSYVAGRALVLVSTALLARLLDPRDFGLVALAITLMTLLETVKDLGVSQALIVVRDEDVEDQAHTAFTLSVGLGVVLSLLTAALAPLAAAFFHEGRLTPLMAVLGLNFLLRALGLTHYALAQRRLDFRSRTVAEIADVVVRGGAGIGLALAGAGPWALVLGYLAGTIAMTSALWLLVDFRPRLRARREHFGRLLRFGGALTGVDALAAMISEADYVFIGRVLGASALGFYVLGFRLPELLVLNFSLVAGRVLFPAFAALDREALGRAFLASLRYTLMLGLPLAALLAVLAEPIVLSVFGSKWESSVDPMRILTLYALGVTLGIPAGSAYKAVGRADVLLKLALPRAALAITAIALVVNDGIAAVAAAQAGVACLFALIGIVLASRLLSVGGRAIWREIWPTLIASAGLAAAALGVDALLGSPLAAALAGAAAGGLVYAALMWLLAREWIERLVTMARAS